jgi:hypothetical protein
LQTTLAGAKELTVDFDSDDGCGGGGGPTSTSLNWGGINNGPLIIILNMGDIRQGETGSWAAEAVVSTSSGEYWQTPDGACAAEITQNTFYEEAVVEGSDPYYQLIGTASCDSSLVDDGSGTTIDIGPMSFWGKAALEPPEE